jgi:hypothetical protein
MNDKVSNPNRKYKANGTGARPPIQEQTKTSYKSRQSSMYPCMRQPFSRQKYSLAINHSFGLQYKVTKVMLYQECCDPEDF